MPVHLRTHFIRAPYPNPRPFIHPPSRAQSRLYYWLGVAIVHTAPPQEQRLQLLNEVWKVVTKLQDAQEYMDIAQIFVEYLLVHFAVRILSFFLVLDVDCLRLVLKF